MSSKDQRISYTSTVLLRADICEEYANPEWLRYGDTQTDFNKSGICIVESGFFGDNYGSSRSLPELPLAEIEGVPLLFGKPLVEKRGNALIVHADIIASAYFLLTRYEEWVRADVRDEHGRFPGKESLAARAGFIDRPIVDEYAALLRGWANEVGIELPEPKRRFSALLTHDVDSIGPRHGMIGAARAVAGGLLGRRTMNNALHNITAALGLERHPQDNLEQVIALDRRLTKHFPPDRCRSVFFFMAGGRSQYDGNYSLRNKHPRSRLNEVMKSDAEIGLHASYEAGENPSQIASEREELENISGRKIEKNRHHFLTWREPEHGQTIADAGIRWDATLGYADLAGFRLGICRPIPLFDPIRRRPLDIEEHPLSVMDCTLDRPNYMNLSEEEAFERVQKIIDETYRHRGEFICLWHNTVLASDDNSYHKSLYPRVLDYLGTLLERNQ